MKISHQRPLANEPTRRCYKCRQNLPVDQFHRCRTGTAGRAKWCKTCTKAYGAAYYRRQHGPAKVRYSQWDQPMVVCIRCGEEKPQADFPRHCKSRRQPCKKCRWAYLVAWKKQRAARMMAPSIEAPEAKQQP